MSTEVAMAPAPKGVVCWRVKGDPSRRLANGEWCDAPIDPELLAEYTRHGFEVEYAVSPDVVDDLVEAAKKVRNGDAMSIMCLRAALARIGGSV